MTTSKFNLKVNPERIGVGQEDINRIAKIIELKGTRSPEALIISRRRMMLVHSYIYYKAGTSAIPDHLWQRWANDLVVLQDSFPEHCELGYYDEHFKDWDASTGMDLPVDDVIVAEAVKEYKLYTGGVLDVV